MKDFSVLNDAPHCEAIIILLTWQRQPAYGAPMTPNLFCQIVRSATASPNQERPNVF
jgi:hypothetical protein